MKANKIIMIEKKYCFCPFDFNIKDKHDLEPSFWDYVEDCALDFNTQFCPLYANAFYANSRTMLEFNKCFPPNDKETFGFEEFEGDIEKDLDINIEIDKFSKYRRTYAIQIASNAVYLIVNDKLADNLFWLRHVLDKNDEQEEEYDPTLNSNIKKNTPIKN